MSDTPRGKEGTRWGEDNPFWDEGIIGALIGASIGFAVGAVFLPSAGLYIFAARFGLVNDAQALEWFDANALAYGLNGAIFLICGIVGAALGFARLVRQPLQWHWQGMEYRDNPIEGQAVMAANERRLMSQDQIDGLTHGVVVGGVELSRTREVAHLSLVGLPGAGKTVIVNSIIRQLLERGDRAIVHDPKGDFTAWLYDGDGGSTVLLGPWDARARWWDVSADVCTPEHATTFAGAMFPKEGGSNDFFNNAARELLAGLIKSYMRDGIDWSWDTLGDDLHKGSANLIDKAQHGDPQIKLLIPVDPEAAEHNRMVQSVMATLAQGASWIASYRAAFKFDREDGMLDRENTFSVRRWLAGEDHGEVVTVLLNNDKNYEVRSQQIFGAIAAAAANYINSAQMPEISEDEVGLWVVLDEYPQLGTVVAKYVQQIEEMGRSRGVRVIKAVQDESQLFAAVGREKGEAQRSVQQTRIYAKLATGTASEVCQRLGERDIVRAEFPQVVGAGDKRQTIVRAPIIRPDELTGLRIRKAEDDDPRGVEIIVHTDDILVKLVHPFPQIEDKHSKVVPSVAWERGILGLKPAAGDEQAAAELEAAEGSRSLADEDDLP